jgi:uncharacterized membrane protein HdeD (DUF308 family)
MATIVDGEVLWKLVLGSLVGGIGVTFCFSLVILGVTRSAELRRDRRGTSATAFAVLAVVALLVIAAGVVYGISILTHKS